MRYFKELLTLSLIWSLGSCGESPYPPEANSITGYTNTPSGYSSYNTKWTAEPPVDPQTFSVQTGYEGYLVPSEPPLTFLDILRTAGLVTLLPPLSKIGVKLALKLGVWALGFLGLFLIGSFFTSAVCAFTPLCTISFLGFRGFNRESVRSLISQDKLNSAAQFMADAITKYKELNNNIHKQKNDKSD